jgi:hypothetical protein
LAKGGGGGSHESSFQEGTVLVGAIVLAACVYLTWTYARQAIVYPLFGVDLLQYKALDGLGVLHGDGPAYMDYASWGLDRKNVYHVDWNHVMRVQNDIGKRTGLVLALILGGLAALTAMKMKGDGFKRQYSLTGRSYDDVFRFLGMRVNSKKLKWLIRFLTKMTFTTKLLTAEKKEWVSNGASFIHEQAAHWKVVLAGAHFDPNGSDERQRPQLSPMEWLKANSINLTKRDGLDDEAAERAFEKQLGPSWQGIGKAPYYVQAIAVMAALNALRDRSADKLRELVTEIHVQFPSKAEAMTRDLIAPYLKRKDLVDSIDNRGKKHAFLYTAAIGIYGAGGPMKEWGGGEAGVFSASMFRWLKPIDRTLWYCLNNVGRRAYHIEGAGAVCHFQAERVLGQPLADPYVESAMDGLIEYLDREGIEDLETFFKPKRKGL